MTRSLSYDSIRAPFTEPFRGGGRARRFSAFRPMRTTHSAIRLYDAGARTRGHWFISDAPSRPAPAAMFLSQSRFGKRYKNFTRSLQKTFGFVLLIYDLFSLEEIPLKFSRRRSSLCHTTFDKLHLSMALTIRTSVSLSVCRWMKEDQTYGQTNQYIFMK